MKAICIEEPGKVVIKEIEKPVRKKGEALLKVLYGGICGSDLNTYRGGNAYVKYPRVPGHEFSAKIVEIDENDLGLKEGMVVTANPYFNCGHCYSCKRGLVNACTDNQTMGVQREGGFAEYITMPIERIYDGKGLDPSVLTLIEPFCISYHGVGHADVKPGEKVLVIGAGTIGVLSAIAAKAKGAEVSICDVAPDKLAYAKETFGLDHQILNDLKDPDAFMRGVNEVTDGNGFDVCIEAAGLASTYQNCIDAACFGARIVVIGVAAKPLNDFYVNQIQKKELQIFGSRNALKKDFLELIDLVSSGKVDLDKIVMHHKDENGNEWSDEYDWLDAPKAFEDFHQNAGKMLKVRLKFADQ